MSKEHAWINKEWCDGMADFIDEKDGNSPTSLAMRAVGVYIATLKSQVKLLREECAKGRLAFENTDEETYDPKTKIEYYAARAATDAAGAMGE